MLSDVDERREEIVRELDGIAEATETARRLRASMGAMSDVWFEDPEALQPDEYLSFAAEPHEVRKAY